MIRTQAERQHALEMLRKFVPEGTRIFTHIESVSRTGMSRKVRAFVVSDGDLVELTMYAATLRGASADGGLRFGGCGYDAGYEMADDIACAAFGVDSTENLSKRFRHSSF